MNDALIEIKYNVQGNNSSGWSQESNQWFGTYGSKKQPTRTRLKKNPKKQE